MNIQDEFGEWVLMNYEISIKELIEDMVKSHAYMNGWDIANTDEMLEELHSELKDKLLNVVDTFKELELKPNGYSGMKTNAGASCPMCGTRLQTNSYLIKQNYCHECGLKLNWE